MSACFCPVAIEQVEIDVSARCLKLRRINGGQGDLDIAVAKGKKQDTVEDSTKYDDDEAVVQECFRPIAQGNWEETIRKFLL